MSVPTNSSSKEHTSLFDIFLPNHLLPNTRSADNKERVIRPRTNLRPKCKIGKPKRQEKKKQKKKRAHFMIRCLPARVISKLAAASSSSAILPTCGRWKIENGMALKMELVSTLIRAVKTEVCSGENSFGRSVHKSPKECKREDNTVIFWVKIAIDDVIHLAK